MLACNPFTVSGSLTSVDNGFITFNDGQKFHLATTKDYESLLAWYCCTYHLPKS